MIACNFYSTRAKYAKSLTHSDHDSKFEFILALVSDLHFSQFIQYRDLSSRSIVTVRLAGEIKHVIGGQLNRAHPTTLIHQV